MMLANQLGVDNLRYIGKILMIKYSIKVFPTFLQLFHDFDFLSFRVRFLEILELQLHNSNADFVKSFIAQLGL